MMIIGHWSSMSYNSCIWIMHIVLQKARISAVTAVSCLGSDLTHWPPSSDLGFGLLQRCVAGARWLGLTEASPSSLWTPLSPAGPCASAMRSCSVGIMYNCIGHNNLTQQISDQVMCYFLPSLLQFRGCDDINLNNRIMSPHTKL